MSNLLGKSVMVAHVAENKSTFSTKVSTTYSFITRQAVLNSFLNQRYTENLQQSSFSEEEARFTIKRETDFIISSVGSVQLNN
jgi:hypothetical protein